MLETGTSECHFQNVHSKHKFRKFIFKAKNNKLPQTEEGGKFIECEEEVGEDPTAFKIVERIQRPLCDGVHCF